jgi:hypothetical protein
MQLMVVGKEKLTNDSCGSPGRQKKLLDSTEKEKNLGISG